MTALTLAQAAATIGSYHRAWGWYAIGLMAFVGLWGLILAVLKREPGKVFWWGFGISTVGIMSQVVMGIYAFSVGNIQPGNQHVFYGVVIMFTLAFAYIYRLQLAKRPALSYGLLALFLMGLGMRAISNFGQNF